MPPLFRLLLRFGGVIMGLSFICGDKLVHKINFFVSKILQNLREIYTGINFWSTLIQLVDSFFMTNFSFKIYVARSLKMFTTSAMSDVFNRRSFIRIVGMHFFNSFWCNYFGHLLSYIWTIESIYQQWKMKEHSFPNHLSSRFECWLRISLSRKNASWLHEFQH